VGVVTKCDIFAASTQSPPHIDRPLASPSATSPPVKTGADHPGAPGNATPTPQTHTAASPATTPHTCVSTHSLKWSVLCGDAYSAGVSGLRPPLRLGGGYVFTMTHSSEMHLMEAPATKSAEMSDANDKVRFEGVDATLPCRYSDMIRQRVFEPSWFMLNDFEDALLGRHAGCGSVVQVLQRMYTDHMRDKWAPMVLKALVDGRRALMDEADALGLPAPPVCIAVTNDDIDYFHDHNKDQCRGHGSEPLFSGDQYAAISFMDEICRAAKHCIYSGIHSMRASFVGSVLGPFMSRLCACLTKPEVIVNDCFVPGSSVDAYLQNVRVTLQDLCGSLLSM
jgi:hypothetical protein